MSLSAPVTATGKTDKLPRKTSQFLMPEKLTQATNATVYNIYPAQSIGNSKIFNGYATLAQWITEQKTVVIDGYTGVFFDRIQSALNEVLTARDLTTNWINTSEFFKPENELNELTAPFMGEADSVWGKRTTLQLIDLFNTESFKATRPDERYDINILIGPGAALAGWEAAIIYIDLPKNELQFRMRSGSITNLGSTKPAEPQVMYKQFYFIDWVLLNAHKKQISDQIAVMVDGQWPDTINWMQRTDLDTALDHISTSAIRVRPWFEPGAWGGQWIKQHIPGINTDVVNYAWSFELIVPENGLVFESDGWLLEVSFDMLMFRNQKKVLGKHAGTFGDEFPIRFDFLDTFEGGNLSIQCHPRLKYIQEVFGETITQDETYYILDCQPDANVYLGFQEDINPQAFRRALEISRHEATPIAITNYVQSHTAQKHDLFLIPNGTVHSAGAGNLVLEISATPYIFTFKMYDWLRLDLDGKPRPININHAFNNLDFDRKGDLVKDELISKPHTIATGADWKLIHLPTHPEHFYDVHRFDFHTEVSVVTNDCCHVLMLVEGESITVETANGEKHTYAYAETFVIPAAAQAYRLINKSRAEAKVIKAFLK